MSTAITDTIRVFCFAVKRFHHSIILFPSSFSFSNIFSTATRSPSAYPLTHYVELNLHLDQFFVGLQKFVPDRHRVLQCRRRLLQGYREIMRVLRLAQRPFDLFVFRL